jgi:7-carboxy-7-deazaguanine synthase
MDFLNQLRANKSLLVPRDAREVGTRVTPLEMRHWYQWVRRCEPINPTRPKVGHRAGSQSGVRSSKDGVRSRGKARTHAAELSFRNCIIGHKLCPAIHNGRRYRYITEMSDTLLVNEIYLSLQGESTFAGLPCIFVRVTACNLRCSYCDTAYAFTEGKKIPLTDVRADVHRLAVPFQNVTPPTHIPRLPLVELTGGEPLLQKSSHALMRQLCDDGFTVLLETSGAHDIASVDPRVRRIMDLKCPSSGEVERNRWENIPQLKATDEIKFVIGTQEDYDWAKAQISAHKLDAICPLLFSWVHPLEPEQQDKALKKVPPGHTPITRRALVEKIIADALPARFQVQMHKVIWPPEQRGV